MSSGSKTKIRPIDKRGIESIEREITLHERKRSMAEKFSDTKSVNFHKRRIVELRARLNSRKAATIRITAQLAN